MVRFIAQHYKIQFVQIRQCGLIFSLGVNIVIQLLNTGKFNFNTVRIWAKRFHFANRNYRIALQNLLGK